MTFEVAGILMILQNLQTKDNDKAHNAKGDFNSMLEDALKIRLE